GPVQDERLVEYQRGYNDSLVDASALGANRAPEPGRCKASDAARSTERERSGSEPHPDRGSEAAATRDGAAHRVATAGCDAEAHPVASFGCSTDRHADGDSVAPPAGRPAAPAGCPADRPAGGASVAPAGCSADQPPAPAAGCAEERAAVEDA